MDQLYRDQRLFVLFPYSKTLGAQTPLRRGVQQYVIRFVSDLRQFVSEWFSSGTPPRFSLNIVESGVKHHKPTQAIY